MCSAMAEWNWGRRHSTLELDRTDADASLRLSDPLPARPGGHGDVPGARIAPIMSARGNR